MIFNELTSILGFFFEFDKYVLEIYSKYVIFIGELERTLLNYIEAEMEGAKNADGENQRKNRCF